MRCSAACEQVWNALIFYEQIGRRPPLPLRLLLPLPLRAEGSRSAAGDETRCVYDRGYLVKRMTRVAAPRYAGFIVVRQKIEIAHGIRLAGGSYRLRELDDGSTQIELETRYEGSLEPRWLWRRIEAAVCHAFHRHILRAIRREADEAEGASRRAALL